MNKTTVHNSEGQGGRSLISRFMHVCWYGDPRLFHERVTFIFRWCKSIAVGLFFQKSFREKKWLPDSRVQVCKLCPEYLLDRPTSGGALNWIILIQGPVQTTNFSWAEPNRWFSRWGQQIVTVKIARFYEFLFTLGWR